MSSIDEQVLRTSKEIVVKFIETGRVSPTGFAEIFTSIYQTVNNVVRNPDAPAVQKNEDKKKKK